MENQHILEKRKDWNAASEEIRLGIAKAILEEKCGESFDFIGFEKFECQGIENTIAVYQHRATEMFFHLIPGDHFPMGAQEQWHEIQDKYYMDLNEACEVLVKVSPFLISRFLITQEAWVKFGGKVLWKYNAPKCSADAIDRDDAQNWARKIGAELPNEAQWEYACKAGSNSIFYWGNEPDLDYAWTEDNTIFGDDFRPLREDEQKKGNAFGLLGMIGNAAEWVADDANDFEEDPQDKAFYNYQDGDGILKGGWNQLGWKLNRSGSRVRSSITGVDVGTGARVVFGHLFNGEKIVQGEVQKVDPTLFLTKKKSTEVPAPQKDKSKTFLTPESILELARNYKIESSHFRPTQKPKLFPYRMGGDLFADFLDFSKGEEKEEYVKSHYIEYFTDYNRGIDKAFKLSRGTSQFIWEDYVRGNTHDGMAMLYWSFVESLGKSFFGRDLEPNLTPKDIKLLSNVEGAVLNNPLKTGQPPTYCGAVEGFSVFIFYRENFEKARLSAESTLSKKGFEIFSSWLQVAKVNDDDIVLFRSLK